LQEKNNSIYLIVGLGNPDPEYQNTPHNIGFAVADKIAEEQEQRWKNAKLVFGDVSKFNCDGNEVVLLKPLTYMNKSGLAVKSALGFWKIDMGNLLVVQDDSDIELGRLKIGSNQSSGGHKGIENIIQAVGSKRFNRLKVGIRPAGLAQSGKVRVKAEKFILRPYPKEKLEIVAQEGVKAVYFWLRNGLEKTMSKYNRKI